MLYHTNLVLLNTDLWKICFWMFDFPYIVPWLKECNQKIKVSHISLRINQWKPNYVWSDQPQTSEVSVDCSDVCLLFSLTKITWLSRCGVWLVLTNFSNITIASSWSVSSLVSLSVISFLNRHLLVIIKYQLEVFSWKSTSHKCQMSTYK